MRRTITNISLVSPQSTLPLVLLPGPKLLVHFSRPPQIGQGTVCLINVYINGSGANEVTLKKEVEIFQLDILPDQPG